ncbi:MAG: energy transducer TonB [Candidatus Kryptoniota bacterium]
MSGLYQHNDEHGSVAGSYYYRQHEIRRIYSQSLFRGLFIALGVHAVVIFLLFLYEPIYKKPLDIEKLLPPVNTNYEMIEVRIAGQNGAGMDVRGAGGGEGTIKENAGAAFGNVRSAPASNKNTINSKASIVPRSLQGPGMNDVVGISRNPAYLDTVNGYNGLAKNSKGSGGGADSGIGNKNGSGAGFAEKQGFGGGFGDKYVPGNPANNSTTGSPYQISWNGVSRALIAGDRPQFPDGVQHGGTVKIRITVDPSGNVLAMVPVQKADSRLEEAAMAAIRTWRFSKLARNYPQVEQQATAVFVFKLE